MSKAQNSPNADAPEAEAPEPRGGGDESGKGARPSSSPSDRDYAGIAIDPPDNTGGGSGWE